MNLEVVTQPLGGHACGQQIAAQGKTSFDSGNESNIGLSPGLGQPLRLLAAGGPSNEASPYLVQVSHGSVVFGSPGNCLGGIKTDVPQLGRRSRQRLDGLSDVGHPRRRGTRHAHQRIHCQQEADGIVARASHTFALTASSVPTRLAWFASTVPVEAVVIVVVAGSRVERNIGHLRETQKDAEPKTVRGEA